MPRLGGDTNSGNFSPANLSRQAQLLARRNLTYKHVLILCLVLFVIKNLAFRDYRREEISELKNSGLSQEEIERFVPTTAAERRKYVADKNNDLDRMKKDIAFLLQEVHELRAMARDKAIAGEGGGVDEALKEMDKIHEEKRRRREQELGLDENSPARLRPPGLRHFGNSIDRISDAN